MIVYLQIKGLYLYKRFNNILSAARYRKICPSFWRTFLHDEFVWKQWVNDNFKQNTSIKLSIMLSNLLNQLPPVAMATKRV